ncbi:MAG: hypothetical protein V4555_17715 [Acidobacteriota bacterium]
MSSWSAIAEPALPTGPPPGQASSALRPILTRVEQLKRECAEAFTTLAALLQSNSQRARQITSASHQSTGAGIAERSSTAIATLQGLLDDCGRVSSMVEISTRKIDEILSTIEGISPPLRKLIKMSSLLQIVSILCRIEGGSIDNASVDINGLSADIDTLSSEVEVHINGMFADSSLLRTSLASGLQQLRSFAQQEGAAAGQLITRSQSVLGPALARSEASQTAARTIDEQYTAFHRATDKVVMSLQSEDIARQRLEHVEHAIEAAASRLDAGSSAHDLASILILQRAQTISIRDLIAASVDAIHAGLDSLGPVVHQLVAETSRLSRQIDQDSQSFAVLVEDGLGSLEDVFTQCASSANSVIAIVASVLPSVEKMTGRARALHEIEQAISIISLNATVKTSQLGIQGKAMGVLAAELHSITRERGSDTAFVQFGLRSVNLALTEIQAGRALTQDTTLLAEGTAHRIQSDFASLAASARSGSEQSAAALNQVRQLAETFANEIRRGVELAEHASALRALFDSAIHTFDEAFITLDINPTLYAAAPGDHHAEQLTTLYSMASERQLHQDIFGGASPESPADIDLGGEVELF